MDAAGYRCLYSKGMDIIQGQHAHTKPHIQRDSKFTLGNELPQRALLKGCFAAYCARSIDELSGRTTGRLGYDRPDSAYAIGGTAELALRYSN